MSKSSLDKKPIGLHLPRITIPRDSIAVRKENAKNSSGINNCNGADSNSTIRTDEIPGTVLDTVPERVPLPIVTSPPAMALSVNVNNTSQNLDPGNDNSIAQVMSDIRTRKSFISCHTGGVRNSLLDQILKAKLDENKRIKNTIEKNSNRARKRLAILDIFR